MIRCSECEHCWPFKVLHKQFYFCEGLGMGNGTHRKLWDKIPVGHPRWCPKRKEEKQNVKKD